MATTMGNDYDDFEMMGDMAELSNQNTWFKAESV